MGVRPRAGALSDGARRDAVRRRAPRARAPRGGGGRRGGGPRRLEVRVRRHVPDLREAAALGEGGRPVEGGGDRRAPPRVQAQPEGGVRRRRRGRLLLLGAPRGGGRRLRRGAVQGEAAGQPDPRRGEAREPEPRDRLHARRVPADARHEPGQLHGRVVQDAQPPRGLPGEHAHRRHARAHLLRVGRRGRQLRGQAEAKPGPGVLPL